MKKFTKIAAAIVALSFILSACAEAPSSSSKKKDRKDDEDVIEETEDTEETTRETKPEREPKDTTASETEELVETEATEETEETTEVTETEASNSIYDDRGVDYTADLEKCYNLFRDLADELHAEDYGDNLRYVYFNNYDDDADCFWFMAVSDGEGTMLYKVRNGAVELVTDPSYIPTACLDYQTFMSIPCFTEIYIYSDEDYATVEILDGVPDGLYFGNVVLIKEDGSKALVEIGTPYVISEEEYEIYKSDPEGYIAGIPELNNAYGWFSKVEGQYVFMTDSDYVVPMNSQFTWVDISPDVEVTDNFPLLMFYATDEVDFDNFQESDYVYNYGDNAVTNSAFMEYMLTNDYAIYFSNGWLRGSAILEPVVITNGEVTSIHFGWR